MKKIQVSTVELNAQSEVIVLNSSFVARTVRAAENLKYIKNHIEDSSKEYVLDNEGNRKKDEKGDYVTKINIAGNAHCNLMPSEVEVMYNNVIPFIEDLCAALLGEEAER